GGGLARIMTGRPDHTVARGRAPATGARTLGACPSNRRKRGGEGASESGKRSDDRGGVAWATPHEGGASTPLTAVPSPPWPEHYSDRLLEGAPPRAVGEEVAYARVEALGHRLLVGGLREAPPLDRMGEKGRLDEHARHVGADEHVEGPALHPEIGDPGIARPQPPHERALHGAGERHRFVHLPHLDEVAQDVA